MLRKMILWMLLGVALPVGAQDAGMVVSTSVGYRTQRASLKLTDAQAKEADLMAQEAQNEAQAGRYSEAMRRYAHGTAAMRGVAWTPEVELVSSFQGKLDHAIAAPGDRVASSLVPLFATARAAGSVAA